ncbi:MAG: MMPL family transporter [Spirochaetales bacterium]|nr:MMPL family transporter [Spirochaetales bacterium]
MAIVFCPLVINTDFYSILPESNAPEEVRLAEAKMSSENNSGMFVLVGHEDFNKAVLIARDLAESVAEHPQVDSSTFEIDAGMYSQMQDFMFEHRYHLQNDSTLALIKEDGGQPFAENALATVYSPFSFSSLAHIAEDPFLLTDAGLRGYLNSVLKNGTKMTLKDNVLTSEKDGISYVLLSIKSKSGASSLSSKDHIVAWIYSEQKRLESSNDEVVFYNSGVPFHSFESSSNAQREITIIATASMLLVILMLILVFRSIGPLVLTLSAIILGVVVAFVATLFIFGEVHMLTLAFGTSLIGISIDYTLHFFTARYSRPECHDGRTILHIVIAGVWLGLLSTLISYSVLLAAPFGLLRQMAVFSIAGLLSVFSTVVFIYPKTVSRVRPTHSLPKRPVEIFSGAINSLTSISRKKKIILLICVTAAAVPGLMNLNFDNDIRGLYTMSKHLQDSERVAFDVLDLGSSGWYFILEGDSEEALLQKEEVLSAVLDKAIESGKLGSFMCTSNYLPSTKRQSEVYEVISKNLMPKAGSQLELLGFGPEYEVRLLEDMKEQKNTYLTIDSYQNHPIGKMTGSFWIGNVEDKYYSAVLPLHAEDSGYFSELAGSMEGVFFINKTAEISETLGSLTLSRLKFLLLAYFVIVFFLSLRYKPVLALKISRGPLAAGVLTCALLGYTGVPLNLFSVMGLVLIIGIGIDYSIFLTESKEEGSSTMLAVILSSLTTIFAFGVLSFSSFQPVSTFGFTLLFGIILSFIIAPINTAFIRSSRENKDKAICER